MEYLEHHGVLGMKWGVRRYQNPDGTLTELGKKRLAKDVIRTNEKLKRQSSNYNSTQSRLARIYSNEIDSKAIKNLDQIKEALSDYRNAYKNHTDFLHSDECREAVNKAREDTIKYFQKNDPEYLKEILNKSKKYEEEPEFLDAHDFRKVFEGYEDSYLTKAEQKYNSNPKHQRTEKAMNDAWNTYISECKKASNNLLGEYGDIKISTAVGKNSNVVSVSDIVSDAIRELSIWK